MSHNVFRDMQKPNSNPYWKSAAPSRSTPFPHQHLPAASSARLPSFPRPALVQKREDAQPNDDSKSIPPRLRRPTEPPAIKPSTSFPIASSSDSQSAHKYYNPAQSWPRRPQSHHQQNQSYHPYRHPDNPPYADHWTRNYAASNLNRSTSYRTSTYQRDHNEHTRWSNQASPSRISNPPAYPWRRQADICESFDSYRPAAPDRLLHQDSHTGRTTTRNSPPAPQEAVRSVPQASTAIASTSCPTSSLQAQSSSSSSQAVTRSGHQTPQNAEITRPITPTSSHPLIEATFQPSKEQNDADGRKAETVTNAAKPSAPLSLNTQQPSTVNLAPTEKHEAKSKVAGNLNPAPTAKPETKSSVGESPRSTKSKVAESPRPSSLKNQLSTADTNADNVVSQASKAPTEVKSKKRALPSHIQESATNGKEIEPPASPSQPKSHTFNSKEDSRPAAKKIKITPNVPENHSGSAQSSAQHSQKSSSNGGEDCAGQAHDPAPQTSSSSRPRLSPPVQPENKSQVHSRKLENETSLPPAENCFKKYEVLPKNQVLASCTVQKSGTRTSVADMIHNLMQRKSVGHTVMIEFLAFGGQEIKDAYLVIGFVNEQEAHKARSGRWFKIPEPLLHPEHRTLVIFSTKSNDKRAFMDRAKKLQKSQLAVREKHVQQDPWVFFPKDLSSHLQPSTVSAKKTKSTKAGSTTHSQANQASAAAQAPSRAVPVLSSKTAPSLSDVACLPVDEDDNSKVNSSSKKVTTSLADKKSRSSNNNSKKIKPGQLDIVDKSDDRTLGKSSCKRAATPSKLAPGSQPNQQKKLPSLDPTGSRSSKLQMGRSDDTLHDSMVPSPSADAINSPSSPSNQLWVKIWCNSSIDHERARNFIHELFEPFGKNLIVKPVRSTETPRVFHLEFQNSQQAEQALESMYGYILPAEFVIQSDEFPRHLEVSSYLGRDPKLKNQAEKNTVSAEVHLPHKDSNQPKLFMNQQKTSTSSSAAPNSLIGTSDASNHVAAQRGSSSQGHDTNSQTNTNNRSNTIGRSNDINTLSTDVTIQDYELAKFSLPEDQTNEAAHLPLSVVKHEMPLNCKEVHPSYAANRLHFKLEKIRVASSKDQTVLDSSWTGEHLILYVVPNANPTAPTTDHSWHHQRDDLLAPQACQKGRHSPDPPPLSPSEDVKPALPVSSPASVVALDDLPAAAEAIERHPTWPFSPKPTYFDDSVTQDLQKTLHDFLATFFRLWEGSRQDLRHLYDESAVFSNILAKQGRKASSITKSTGWSNIYKTIRKLPALSNEPLADSIMDAWPMATFPPRVLCVVHGTFMEFDKATKRAFDRTFVLRPVDVNLNPSEGCLGLLKWIILSDTLTIRKNSSQTTAVVEGFRQQRISQADRCNYIRDMSSPNFEKNHDPSQPPSCAQLRHDRGRSTLSASSHPSRLSSAPLLPPDSPSSSSDTPLANLASRSFNSPAQMPSTNRLTPEVPPSTPEVDLVQMQAQLKVMQSEIERLKSSSHVPNRATCTSPRQQPSQEFDTVLTPSNSHLRSRPSERRPNSRPSNTQNTDNFEIRYSSSHLHKGLGVARKRLMIPTDLSSYLVVSMRGDILSWDKTNRSKVQLLLSGASPTDLVDSACYSSSSKTLVVGSRPPPAARDAGSSQISLVKMRESSTGSLTCERVQFDDRLHEGGIRATCLLPQSEGPDMPLAFVTAGQEKHLVIWKIIRGHKETFKISTDHTSIIHTLAPCNHRNWILSGGQDGRVYATDMKTTLRRLLLAEKHPIIDIQVDEMSDRNHIMVTAANKNPERRFQYCDLRLSDPVLRFGFPPAADGISFDSSVKTHLKGSLMDKYFAHPTGDNGGVRIWDLRSTRTHLLKVSSTPGYQAYFESLKTLLTLDRDTLTHVEFR